MPLDLQKLHSVMVPGYCEPQLLYLFQVRVPFIEASFLQSYFYVSREITFLQTLKKR